MSAEVNKTKALRAWEVIFSHRNLEALPVIQAIYANSNGGARRLCGNTSTSKRPLERIAELRMK